jgi:hypothetical protein
MELISDGMGVESRIRMCEAVNSIMGRCKGGVVQWQEAVELQQETGS